MMQQSNTIQSVPRLQTFRNAFRLVYNPIPVIQSNIQNYGKTHSFYLAGIKKGFLSSEPDFVQYFMQKNHRNYRKSKVQTEQLKRYLGNGLLTSDGAYWLKQRRLIQPGFHRKRLAALVQIIDATVEEFIEGFRADCQKGPVDIYHQMMELTFQVVIKSLFSSGMTDEELSRISNNITEVQEFFIQQVRMPFLNPWFKLSGQTRAAAKKAEEMNYILLDIIKSRRSGEVVEDDLLQMLLEARYEENNEGMTDQQVLEEAIILFVAGHETTANAMAWTWYLLSQHPECVQKIRTELDTVLGNKTPSFDQLPQLEYLTQVIQESMRIYPPAWITDRVAIEDDEIKGHFIPKDSMVIAYIYGMHHDPDIWENPEAFLPERFSKSAKKERHSLAYMPFGAGPRLCIGNNFALMEMQLILAKMIQAFDLQLVPNQKIEIQPLITLRPRNGIKLQFLDR